MTTEQRNTRLEAGITPKRRFLKLSPSMRLTVDTTGLRSAGSLFTDCTSVAREVRLAWRTS